MLHVESPTIPSLGIQTESGRAEGEMYERGMDKIPKGTERHVEGGERLNAGSKVVAEVRDTHVIHQANIHAQADTTESQGL